MFRTIRLTAALALMAIGVLSFATPAQAHDAAGSASCDGAVLDADSYDGSMANTYSLTVDQDTRTGTFGASVHATVPVPQDGAVHNWSYTVQAADGAYHFADAGQVGPCGTPPVVDVCADLDGDQPVGTMCTAPPATVAVADTTALDCDAREQVTTTTTTTTPFVFDQTTQTWIPGTPVETQVVTSQPAQPGDCANPPVDHCPGLDGVQNGNHDCGVDDSTPPPTGGSSVSQPQPVVFAAAPAVLPAAGAARVSSSNATWSQLIGGAALAGGVLLLAGLALRRRTLVA